jgi:hypothetical protein
MKSPQKTVFERILAITVLLALVMLPFAVRAESHMPHHPPAFADFDQDGDGFVSEDEFNATRDAHHAAMAKEGRPMKGMATAPSYGDIDTDGDGRLTEAELTAAQHAHMKAMHEAHAGMGHGQGHGQGHGEGCGGNHGEGTHAFADVDTDGDGCISPAEFDAHHAKE